jgi:ABC-type multidrug transport system fused ATPase/permease subunit
MIIIVWRGAGSLVPLIFIVYAILDHFIIDAITKNDNYSQEHYWPLALSFFLSAITTWFIGRYLNKGTLVRSRQTGEVISIKNYHHLMLVPVQYFAILFLIASVASLSTEFFDNKNSDTENIPVEKPSLVDKISFNTQRLKAQLTNKDSKFWVNKDGDILGLYYSASAIDSPEISSSVDDIRNFYRKKAASMNGAIIEVDKEQIGPSGAIKAIIKVPQENAGVSYLGYLIIPVQGSYYFFKMTCKEEGTTGLRESNIMDQLERDGQIKISNDGSVKGWSQDPYDASNKSALMRNLSEDEQYDKDFPRHPLSRLRACLKQIIESIKIG